MNNRIVALGAIMLMIGCAFVGCSIIEEEEKSVPIYWDSYYGLQRGHSIEVNAPFGSYWGSESTGTGYVDGAMPAGLTYTPNGYKGTVTADGSIANGVYHFVLKNTVDGVLYSKNVYIVINDNVTDSLSGVVWNANVGQWFDQSDEVEYPLEHMNSNLDYGLSGLTYSVNGATTRIYGTPTVAGLYVMDIEAWNAEAEEEQGYYIYVAVNNPSFTHTITYNGNGATSGSVANTVVTDTNSGNSNVTLANNGFYKAGYTFGGWSVGGVTYQPGSAIAVGGNASVTATAVWIENTLSASANNMSGISGQSLTNQITAVANNGATFTFAIKSVSAGTASVNSGGLVTFNAPSVSGTTSCNVVVTVTAHYPDGQTKAVDCAFSVSVDPVLSFTNSVTSGTLSIKGA